MADSFIPLKFKIDGAGVPTSWSEFEPSDTAVMPGSFNFTGNGRRILGDFSSATLTNRLCIQSSTANGTTGLSILPNGTNTSSTLAVFNNSNPTNAGLGSLFCTNTEIGVTSDRSGSGTYLPLNTYTGGVRRLQINTSGQYFFDISAIANTWDGAGVAPGVYISQGQIGSQMNTDTNMNLAKATGYTSGNFINFNVIGVQRGSITTNGTSTSYNTTSDYRAKFDILVIENATSVILALRPVTYKWITAPEASPSVGFIAHELQDVFSEAVYGEKDAVDKNGNPIYQQVDYSKLVPLLTAALQESIRRIENLESTIASLTSV